MRIIASTGIGFAFAVSAFAFFAPPASAVERPVLLSKPQTGIIKVEEHDRCERVRRDCRERHHDHEREYQECVKAERCEP
jgi:hypothetical protein